MLLQHMLFESIEGISVIKYIEDYIYCFIDIHALKVRFISVFLLNNVVIR